MSDITERITTYLINGGAFIPELADHRAVRDLLIDARTDLAALRTDLVAERERADAHYRALENVTAKKERLTAERYALRSELAAANDMKRRMTDACEEANRVAEQYRAELAAATARLENALNEGAKRRAERGTLRNLLWEAREQLWLHGPDTLCARIDAALVNGCSDEKA